MPEITPIINGGAISRWVESTPSEETLLALNENGQVVASNAVMQSALLEMWREIYERTEAPSTAGVPWNRFGHVVFTSDGPTGLGAMVIGENFVVS